MSDPNYPRRLRLTYAGMALLAAVLAYAGARQCVYGWQHPEKTDRELLLEWREWLP